MIENGETKSGPGCRVPVTGPKALVLSAVHPLGPLAVRSKRPLEVPALAFTLENDGPARISSVHVSVAPLERAKDGASVAAELSLSAADAQLSGDSVMTVVSMVPHMPAVFELSARGALPPGDYQSILRIWCSDRDAVQSIPITVRISAHPLWAVCFMLFGLAFLGLLSLLSGASDVSSKMEETLTLRQTIHEFLERHPPSEAEWTVVASMDDRLLSALEMLTRPRPVSVQDTRIPQAEKCLAWVREQFEELRARERGRGEGEEDVRDLTREWEALMTQVTCLRARVESEAPIFAQQGQWPSILSTFIRTFDRSLMSTRLSAIEIGLSPHVHRVALVYAAGEGQRARELTKKVRGWLRRASRMLERGMTISLVFRYLADEMIGLNAVLEALVRSGDLPEDAQKAVLKRIEVVREVLEADLSLQGFRNAYSGLQNAMTFALQVQSREVIQAYEAAVREKNAEASLDDIVDTMSRIPQDVGREEKTKHILSVLDVWERKVETCRNDEFRNRLQTLLEDLRGSIRRGDLEGAIPGFKGLVEGWEDYAEAEIKAAGRSVLEPFCRRLASGIQEGILSEQQLLSVLEPHPSVAGLEEELGCIRLDLDGVSEDKCLNELLRISERVCNVGDTMFMAAIKMYEMSPEARLFAAKHSEISAAITLAKRLMSEPWHMELKARTSEEELYTGREILFELVDLDPAWGPGVKIAVDFGDGTAPLMASAEVLRRNPQLAHKYLRPAGITVKAIAATGILPNTLKPEEEELGHGELNLEIRPSPVSAAAALAGVFLNLRFFIALALGLLIQSWRLYTNHPFGAIPRDYLEAFVLGLGVDAGLSGVLEMFGGIP